MSEEHAPVCACGITRRAMLALALGGGAAAAWYLYGSRRGIVISAEPGKPETSEEIDIGAAADYPPGTVKEFRERNFIVMADEDGIYAMSLLCTHKLKPIAYDRGKGQFVCPAHGAIFAKDGTVLQRPATADLPWYSVREKDGRLLVDIKTIVAKGTRYKRPAEA